MNAEKEHPEDLTPMRSKIAGARTAGARRSLPPRERTALLLALALFALAAAGLVYWRVAQARQAAEQAAAQSSSAYKTTTVRRSDLTISISGSGTVIPVQTTALVFPAAGTVETLDVQPGDRVSVGQALAALEVSAALKQEILDQQLAVQVAQQALDDLRSGASAALAQAQASQASAARAYAEAQAGAHSAGDARCAPAATNDYYTQYLKAQKSVDVWEGYLNDPDTGYGYDYLIQKLTPMRKERDQAYNNYTYCQGYTTKEIETSHAALGLAKAKLEQANADYEVVKASSGVDPVELEIAEAALKSARLALASAQNDLAGSTLTAPVDGTVIAVNGKVGEAAGAGSGAFITIASLDKPQVQVNIDETDLQNFAVGCAAVITFDSLVGQTFTGVVTQVSPALVTVNNASMVQGLVALEQEQLSADGPLAMGTTAAVEVTCEEAKNALVVPAQALYQPKGQPAYVYTLDGAGQPVKREVVVGLKTVASAEITGGLSEGEKVITSQVEEQ